MHNTNTFADYFAIFRRRYPTILLTTVAILVPGVFFTYSLPPIYRSTASFLVEQQSISQDIVQTTVTGFTDEQIQEVRQRVMSKSNLIGLVEKYGLYSDVADDPAQAVDLLKSNTLFTPSVAEVVNERTGRTMLATITFDVSFDYSDPVIAQRVATDLADSYLRQNEVNRLSQVEATIAFVESDIRRLEREVDLAASRLSEFRRNNPRSLPDQANTNFRSIDRLQDQLLRIEDEMRKSRDRKLKLEAELIQARQQLTGYDSEGDLILGSAQQLSELQRERLRLLSLYSPQHPDVIKIDKEIQALSTGADNNAYVTDIRAQLNVAQLELAEARQRYSDNHPDVIQKTQAVNVLEKQLQEAIASSQSYAPKVVDTPATRVIVDQIAAVESDIRNFSRQRSELSAQIQELDSRLQKMPEIEREFAALTRDSEQAVARYNEALEKLDEAKMAERLEQHGGGERFTLIGSPNIPANPYKPNRTAWLMMFTVLSIGSGLIFATVLDALDRTIKSAADIMRLTDTPMLAVIPFIETPADRRQRIAKNAALMGIVAISFVTIIHVIANAN